MTPAIIILPFLIDLCTIITTTIRLKVNSPCDPCHSSFNIGIVENNSSVFPTKLKRYLKKKF